MSLLYIKKWPWDRVCNGLIHPPTSPTQNLILSLKLKVKWWSDEGQIKVRWRLGECQEKVKWESGEEFSGLDVGGRETCTFLVDRINFLILLFQKFQTCFKWKQYHESWIMILIIVISVLLVQNLTFHDLIGSYWHI